jgi:GNAT superfamily N-acetyltransferase
VIDRILSRAESDCATDIRNSLALDETAAAEIAGQTMAAILRTEGTQNEIGHICCARNIRRVGEYWCSVDEKLRIARLQYLFIAAQWRRRGYGAGAIAAIHAKLGEMGCCRIELNVLASNAAALALYRSCGYEVDSYEMTCALPSSAPQKAD